MKMVNDIKIGQEIRDKVFKGNPFSQLSLIRKSLWALNILRDTESSEEDITKANKIIEESLNIDKEIEDILNKYYPTEEVIE